ncbi:MAG: hypothetical protein E6J39_00945 [Chloroflexi bacterium]|nr:MAG: hypothetical protein E6J39_00945 [Chloroflexota bacterium]
MNPRLARLLVHAYPPSWRRRYGSEYAALLEDLPATLSAVSDAVRAGLAVRGRALSNALLSSGGPDVTIDFGGWQARTFALLAILVALPTTIVLALSALAYNVGVPGMATAIAPIQSQLLGSKLIGLGLMGAPVLAFVIAVLPVLRLSIQREAGELMISFAIRGRALTLVAAVLSLLLIAFFAMHSATEFLFGT